jgi:hypothetical protein
MNKVLGSTIVLIVLAVIGWIVYKYIIKKNTSGYEEVSAWTVYGTDECGWTRKQLKEMDDKGVAYTYINCKDGDCGEIKSYPTLKNGDGEVKVGFTTF